MCLEVRTQVNVCDMTVYKNKSTKLHIQNELDLESIIDNTRKKRLT